MTERDDGIDEATAATITRNIDLAFRMLGELINDATKVGQVPDGATVFVAPPADPPLEREQTRRAFEAAAGGKNAYLWRLGKPTGERSAWQIRALTPRWPTAGIDPVGVYDRRLDLLVMDFFNGRRLGTVEIPTPGFGTISVDDATGEVVVNALPAFLGKLVPRDPTLIDVLLRPETELRGITRAEVATLRTRLRGEAGLHQDAEPATFASITEHLQQLAAA